MAKIITMSMKNLTIIALLSLTLVGCNHSQSVRLTDQALYAPTGTRAATHLCIASSVNRGNEHLLFSGSLVPAEKHVPYQLFVQCNNLEKTGESNSLLIGIDRVQVITIRESTDFSWIDDMLALSRENDGMNLEFSPTVSVGLFTATGPGDPARIDKTKLPFQQCLLLCDTLTGCYLAWSRESGWIGRRAMKKNEKAQVEASIQ